MSREQAVNPQGYNYKSDPENINPFWEEGHEIEGEVTATATLVENGGEPGVSVDEVPTSEGVRLDFTFENLKGEDGEDGITPNVTAAATVSPTTGTPAVTVTKTGTDAAPVLNFSFSGLKGETGAQGEQGEKGDKGDTGATGAAGQNGTDGVTPNIQAVATVTNNVGDPSCQVVKTGTLTNPVFTFNFDGIKGEQGEQGIQGETGQNGANGVTPNISVFAHILSGTVADGDPTCTVTRSGADSAPIFQFDFDNILPKVTAGNFIFIYIPITSTQAANGCFINLTLGDEPDFSGNNTTFNIVVPQLPSPSLTGSNISILFNTGQDGNNVVRSGRINLESDGTGGYVAFGPYLDPNENFAFPLSYGRLNSVT